MQYLVISGINFRFANSFELIVSVSVFYKEIYTYFLCKNLYRRYEMQYLVISSINFRFGHSFRLIVAVLVFYKEIYHSFLCKNLYRHWEMQYLVISGINFRIGLFFNRGGLGILQRNIPLFSM